MAIKKFVFEQDNHSISYEIRGHGAVDVIILHGWGSNKRIMQKAFEDKFSQMGDFREIYIDLCGFGLSPQPPQPMGSFDYARVLGAFLKVGNFKSDIVLGHSFGGKVATLLAPRLLILLSSAGCPLKKSRVVRFKISIFKALKKVGITQFREFFVSKDGQNLSSVMYESFKMIVNEHFFDEFRYFKNNYPQSQSLCFWGEEDQTTPLITGERIAKALGASLQVYAGDHYFFIVHARDIVQKTMKTWHALQKESANAGN